VTGSATRRDLLRIGAAVGGALVLELVLPGCSAAIRPIPPGAGPGDFVPNAWIRVTPEDRVVFTLDRVEMGQGTMTSHAQLVAEELAVKPEALVIVLADADRAYDNPALGLQMTGGSSSVKASFLPLRRAAATAREMLRAAAARRWAVPIDGCAAEDGAIVHAATGRRARYGELCAQAAHEAVPADVTLRPAAELRVIGTSVARLDARSKVDGSAIYGIDVKVPGLCTAVVLRPPVLGATLVRFDGGLARTQPGVVDIVAIPQGVAVVAERYWQARRAAASVQVVWSEGEAWIDSDALRASYLARAARPATAARSDGDAEGAERKAARVLTATYELPYLAHAPLEPQNATASVTEHRCEVWAPTQSPGLAKEVAHRVTGLPYEAIVIHQTLLGGGFGRRLAQDYVEEAVEVSRRVRRPVKVLFSREDEMRHSQYRPMAVSVLRGGLDAGGAIVSWHHRVVTQSILAQSTPDYGALLPDGTPMAVKLATVRAVAAVVGGNGVPDPSSVEGAATVAYAIPNLRVELASVAHAVPVGPWRSVGYSHTVFAVESFFDELALAAGKDPFLLRRELLARAPRERAVLELCAARAGWGGPLPAGRGRGIAQAKAFGTACAHVAEVSVERGQIKIHRFVSAIDCGTVVNPGLVRAQVESAIAFGLSAALKQEITLRGGRVVQGNFHEFEPLRLHEMPEVEVHLVPSDAPPSGVGEPGVPAVAPAVANAVFAAVGRRLRVLPLARALALPQVPG